ncbi:nuclear transport factor 2 family protein [Streptosporangium sp. 'caverna']|uniref:YybH family protein n=1 Tax=Streptosporangium sp. 'caverna' TaxID=2202249 RepID=UPI000D7D960A|nr:nuclear transport factor 2 family protein [Streptosporangium sp. 'caverna']AWS48737.1 DUF4440 domain-containing protein [Streptosporangium sp. 'caverna']
MTSNDSEVRALLESRVDACQAKDIDRLMSLYSSNIVYYDVVPPLRFAGSDEVRRNFLRWFDEYDGPIGLETHGLTVTTSADVAFAHMLHLDTGTRKNGLGGAVWLRSTVCCRRSSDTWLITHEHISLPINPDRSWVLEGRRTEPG